MKRIDNAYFLHYIETFETVSLYVNLSRESCDGLSIKLTDQLEFEKWSANCQRLSRVNGNHPSFDAPQNATT